MHQVHPNLYVPPQIADTTAITVTTTTTTTPLPQQGNLTNLLTWTLLDEGIDGRLEVECDYVFDARGWMNVSLRRHRLLPNQMPRDPKDLAVLLQRAMPHEFWDPNGHAMETTVRVRPLFCCAVCSRVRAVALLRAFLPDQLVDGNAFPFRLSRQDERC